MTDADLIGYLLDALDPDDRVAVEARLRADPDAAVRLDQLRLALVPLEADREPDPAPAGLAVRAVARLAAHLVEHEPRLTGPAAEPTRPADLAALLAEGPAPASAPLASPAPPRPLPRAPREAPETRAVGGRLRPDLFVAGGIALFAAGLVFSAVGKLRAQHEVTACQNALRTLHTGLAGYADTHEGRYPQVGVASAPTADSFIATLAQAGQLPADFRAACPACPAPDPAGAPAVGYTYTLGYRAPGGGLAGLRRPDGTPSEHDLLPISADYPTAAAAPAAGPVCPHGWGMNVLFVGGHVRVTTSQFVGPGEDDIFRNRLGQVAAGVDRTDVVLGRPGDRP